MTTRVTSRPDELVSSRLTYAPVSIDTFGYDSAGSTQTTSASLLALTRHAKPSQVVAANAPTRLRVCLVQHDPQRCVKRLQPSGGELVVQLLHARLVADRRECV